MLGIRSPMHTHTRALECLQPSPLHWEDYAAYDDRKRMKAWLGYHDKVSPGGLPPPPTRVRTSAEDMEREETDVPIDNI